MFIGHIALGLAAKRAVPRVSLAMLIAAAQLADILWPVFIAIGLEQVRIAPGFTAFTPFDFISYPYSHSLLFLILWGLLLGFGYRAATGDRRAFFILAALVVSHWVLDFVTHARDMPLYPGSEKFGLVLWRSIPATMALELAMYAVGLWVYLRATRARDGIGRWGFLSLAVFLVIVYVASIGTAPPSVLALAFSALAGIVLLTVWSWWADRHRAPRGAAAA
jgi:membrane-bound metal-dependent hydrolase YbcI (DUF457 family)